MAAHTAAGTRIYIGGTGDLETETNWEEIAEVVNIPAFGRAYTEVTHTPLGNRAVQKFKGSFDDGTIDIEMAQDLTDPGQAALWDALDDDTPYNFRITLNDAPEGGTPTTYTFKARVMSYQSEPGSVDSVVSATAQLGILSGTIEMEAADAS